jgi:hypothetical protein
VLQVCFTIGTSRLKGCCAKLSEELRPNTSVKPARARPPMQNREITTKEVLVNLIFLMGIYSSDKLRFDRLIREPI